MEAEISLIERNRLRGAELLTGRGGGLSCLGGGIWARRVFSGVSCHVERKMKKRMSQRRYKSSMSTQRKGQERISYTIAGRGDLDFIDRGCWDKDVK